MFKQLKRIGERTMAKDKPTREEAPEFVYVVFDSEDLVSSFEDEARAYKFAGDAERVVTFRKAT